MFFFRRPVFMNTTAEASPFTNVTIDTTNTNNPQITQSQTATQTLTNTNNDQDQNTSDSDNQITNTGNTVTVNNNGRRRKRRKRSLKELLDLYLDKSSVDEKFMERYIFLINRFNHIIVSCQVPEKARGSAGRHPDGS